MSNIVVVGDIILDTQVNGPYTKIGNEEVPVIGIEETVNQLGASANVANNIKTLGGDVCLFGTIGNDNAGDIVRQLLDSNRVPAFLYERPKTTHKTRVNGILRLDDEVIHKNEYIDNMLSDIRELAPKFIVVSDYAKGDITQRFFEGLLKLDVPLIVDPKKLDYTGSYILTPTIKEAINLTGESELEKIAQSLLLMSENVIVTQGRNGMTLFRRNYSKHFPTNAIEVYDVLGAGDMVVSVLTLMLSKGYSLDESIPYANKAAGIVCAHRGQYQVSGEELGP